MQARRLTYEERNAAEAAFCGEPFDNDWSADAKIVYRGIVDAMGARQSDYEFAICHT